MAFAASLGTMLLCDAWFDVTTSAGGRERMEAVLEAIFAELPLAAICGYIVYDAERFLLTVRRLRRPTPAARRAVLRAMAATTPPRARANAEALARAEPACGDAREGTTARAEQERR